MHHLLGIWINTSPTWHMPSPTGRPRTRWAPSNGQTRDFPVSSAGSRQRRRLPSIHSARGGSGRSRHTCPGVPDPNPACWRQGSPEGKEGIWEESGQEAATCSTHAATTTCYKDNFQQNKSSYLYFPCNGIVI